MDDIIYWLWISRLRRIGTKKLLYLLKSYQTPKKIWKLGKEDLTKIRGIGDRSAEEILKKEYRINLLEELKKMQEENIQILTINDKDYPILLKEIYDPPIVLYVKGNKRILNELSIGVIGCRQCSSYGEIIAKRIAYCLARKHIHIISGLARGIDTYSHIRVFTGKGKNYSSFRKWARSDLSKRKCRIGRRNNKNRRSSFVRI